MDVVHAAAIFSYTVIIWFRQCLVYDDLSVAITDRQRGKTQIKEVKDRAVLRVRVLGRVLPSTVCLFVSF